MSIEQVRKVLENHYSRYPLTNEAAAAEIHALYASERGGDDVKEDLKNAIADWRGGSSYPCDLAAAILRAINARVGAKTAREGGVHAPIVEALDTVCEGWDDKRYASDKPHTDADMAAAAIRALAEAKAQAEMDAKRAADNLLAVQGLLHQAITASAQVAP